MKHLFFLAISVMAIWNSYTQTTTKGTVVDPKGAPIPFVTVAFQNSAEGTITDVEGRFSLTSTQNHSYLEFSFVGFKTAIINLSDTDRQNLLIVLQEETESLSEVKIFSGKTSKKNNPAVDILRKIWMNKRTNGLQMANQYSFRKYEKIEFDLNSIDSSYIQNQLFNGMEFIFDDLDTNKLTGKTFLPVFLNESVSRVYGSNSLNKRKEELLGNKNSGFSDNQILIDKVKGMYEEVDIYKNHLQYFDKNFVSPLSTTGIDVYNYVLADSAYIGNKFCYNIYYYPRRENELTFKGDFWVNDSTWAIKKINLEMTADANINWVKEVFIEQEFEVVNDSVFLMTKDFFMVDFSLNKKEQSPGVYGKRSVLYDDFDFEKIYTPQFYDAKQVNYDASLYNKNNDFWKDNRIEALNDNELGIYKMLDTLQTVPAFKRLYDVTTTLSSGYIEMKGWDYGPVFSTVGYNEVEGLRLRAGGRTYFDHHDPWRIEGYTAYGFKDDKFKYGILGQVLLEKKYRIILSGGKRRDVTQLGASLTNTTDVLGRGIASSSLLNMGDNDKLSSLDLSALSIGAEPFKNVTLKISASYRNIVPASPTFSLSYFTDNSFTEIDSEINQAELSTSITFTPGRITSGFGVERNLVDDNFPTYYLSYGTGIKDFLGSDFDYQRFQFLYNKPLMIGGIGRAHATIEAGKTFGTVPLALLSVVPGNQSFFKNPNTFSLLNFYEFVTDTYAALHFEHNFNGILFSRIPGLRKLNLREIIGIKTVWGEISESNQTIDASGLELLAPSEEPYWEYSAGIGNIFKFFRIDANFRGNYFENSQARTFGVTAGFGFHF